MRTKNNLKFSFLTLLLPLAAAGQTNLYIPPGATVYSFGRTAIFGNVENNGNFGTVAGDTITFYGASWTNATSSTMPTVGTGGLIRFVQPRPAPYANNVTQTINGGWTSGTQPSFPKVEVANPNNVSLGTSKTRITTSLGFTSGKLILNANDLVLGGSSVLNGYDQNKYVVTNNTAAHLVKESYTGNFVYPVGRSTSDYTPAAINNTTANGWHVNVADYASTPAAPRGVSNNGINRTWNIYADNATGTSVIDLQHNNATNEVKFNPALHYVTRYVGTAPNSAGDFVSPDAWERNTPGPGTATGTLTTGAPIANASERNRTYTTFATSATANSAYYTKASDISLCLNARAYLEGALMNSTATAGGRPLMRDDLRASPFTGLNYIPAKDPYEFATPYLDVTSSYTVKAPQSTDTSLQHVSDSATVFSVTGQNAVVDWVFVELRSKSNMANVIATRSALLQRDGDIVDVNNSGCLNFQNVPVDSYYVAVRHRSHLGAMTRYAQSSANLQTLVDFTVPSTPIYDKGVVGSFNYTGLGEKDGVVGSYRALWQGDMNANGKVKYDNPDDDLSVMLFDVLLHPNNTNGSTNFDFAYGYRQGDYDMNSKTKFDNPDDDNSLLLFQILLYPQNANGSTNFDFMIQQLP